MLSSFLLVRCNIIFKAYLSRARYGDTNFDVVADDGNEKSERRQEPMLNTDAASIENASTSQVATTATTTTLAADEDPFDLMVEAMQDGDNVDDDFNFGAQQESTTAQPASKKAPVVDDDDEHDPFEQFLINVAAKKPAEAENNQVQNGKMSQAPESNAESSETARAPEEKSSAEETTEGSLLDENAMLDALL